MNFAKLSSAELRKFLAMHEREMSDSLSRDELVVSAQNLYEHLSKNQDTVPFTVTYPVLDLVLATVIQLEGEHTYTFGDILQVYPHFVTAFELDYNHYLTPQRVVRILQFMDKLKSIDPFDFGKYHKEYALFDKYFSGPELYLRAANYIMYKYENLVTRERIALDQEVLEQSDIKQYLADLTDVSDIQELLDRWYYHFNITKYDENERLNLICKYIFAEEVMFNGLYRTYVDSSYDRYAALSMFSPCERPRHQ